MASEDPGPLRKLGAALLNATLMLAAIVLVLAVVLVWQVRGLAQDVRGGLRSEIAEVQPRIDAARETARQALAAVDDARTAPAADREANATELDAVQANLRALIDELGSLQPPAEGGDETESLIRQLVLAIFATAARGLMDAPNP